MDKCMKMWRWADAPNEYTQLSTHGGDEDWVFVVPATMREFGTPMALWGFEEEETYLLGYGHVDRHDMPNGDLVVIFAHA